MQTNRTSWHRYMDPLPIPASNSPFINWPLRFWIWGYEKVQTPWPSSASSAPWFSLPVPRYSSPMSRMLSASTRVQSAMIIAGEMMGSELIDRAEISHCNVWQRDRTTRCQWRMTVCTNVKIELFRFALSLWIGTFQGMWGESAWSRLLQIYLLARTRYFRNFRR